MTWLRFIVAAAIIVPALLWTMPHPWFVTAIIAVIGLVAGRLAQSAALRVQADEESPGRRKLVLGLIAAAVALGVAAGIAAGIVRGLDSFGENSPPGASPSPLSFVERPVEVVLGDDGALTVAGQPLVLTDVPKRLQELGVDRGVIVVTREGVDPQALEALIEQISAAGVEKFALRTEP